jgi:hypothetical protein
LDWSGDDTKGRLTRAIFVASRQPLRSAALIASLPAQQTLCADDVDA